MLYNNPRQLTHLAFFVTGSCAALCVSYIAVHAHCNTSVSLVVEHPPRGTVGE